jgi:hypothetical protein
MRRGTKTAFGRVMVVFREQRSRVALGPVLRELADEVSSRVDGCVPHDVAVGWLIECGEIEAAVVDALCVEVDAAHALVEAFAGATVVAAELVVASWRSLQTSPCVARLAQVLAELAARAVPLAIDRTVSEGYAYYSLMPEMYIEAAAAVARRWRPIRVCVIGIRSIGTSLAAVVAGEFRRQGIACDRVTVRPRGHPFSRRLVLAASLEDDWRRQAQAGALFVVVDEGPGLSGSSFASVIAELLRFGVDAERIIIMPSWSADVEDVPASPFEEVWLPRLRRLSGQAWRDVSGGAWRRESFDDEAEYPAVQPQHERRKYRVSVSGSSMWMKWAGLGRYGRAHQARAAQVAEWGVGPAPVALASGFLTFAHVPGRPLRAGDRPAGLLSALAEYLARVACDCRVDAATSTSLVEMLRVNIDEGLGAEWQPGVDVSDDDAIIVCPDGRMFPHEWLLTPDGRFVKTDSFEHGDDHFYPGPTDIAWDVAATCVEWRLTPREEAEFLHRYVARSGDAQIARRLAFYRAAYLAFRLGYACLASAAPIGEDARRFQRDQRAYRRVIRAQKSANSDGHFGGLV